MNALVTIDRILSPAEAGVVLTAAVVFAPKGVETVLSKLEAEVRATPQDMTTDEGREAIKALAYKVSRSKTALDEMGKELGAENYKAWKAITAERNVICERLDALRDEVRGPLTAWEEAETARVDGHERALVWIIESPRFATTPTVAMIRAQLSDLAGYGDRDWQEFRDRAEPAIGDAMDKLEDLLGAAIQAEADAAELAELRKLKADREAADNAAAVAAQAEATRKIAAEQQAARDAERAEQEKAREIARAEQVEKDKAAAVAKAIEDTNKRVAAEHAATEAARLKREQNTRVRNKVHAEITHAIDQAFNGAEYSPERLVEAIAAGLIPHVSITY